MANPRTTPDPVTDYARGVVAGDTPACKFVKQACERHLRDLGQGAARGLRFDAGKAARAVSFFGLLRHSKGEWAGQAFRLQPWQAFIVGSVFGWLRADGSRRFRSVYCELPRKQGKSTMAAGMGLYLLLADGEPGAEIYTAATMRDQARIVHGEAVRMVKQSPGLANRVQVYRDNLSVPSTFSRYAPLGADADTLDGLNPSAVIIDELHAHKSRKMYDVLDTATGSRRQPLLFAITTAGVDRTGVCYEQRGYAERVLGGVLPDDTLFAFISTVDDGDDWRDPAVWVKANPNWGVSVKSDDFAEKCNRAKDSVAAQNAFLRLRLNVWTEQEVRWLDMARWDACGAPFDPAELDGKECYGGLDLANSLDLAALVLVFPWPNPTPGGEGGYRLLPFFWVPREGLRQRERQNRFRLDPWVQRGLIRATPGDWIDHDEIERQVLAEVMPRYDVRGLAYDPYNAEQCAQHLAQGGLPMRKFLQSMPNYTGPSKELERLMLAGLLWHGGHPVLRWMASNVAAATNAKGDLMPSRKGSADKIDGIVAACMGLAEAMLRPAVPSVYETRGVLGVEADGKGPAPAAAVPAPTAATAWGGDWGEGEDD